MNIPIVKCETQEWWSTQNDDELVKEIKDTFFCLDLKDFKIHGGGGWPRSDIMMDLYVCQPGSLKPCNPTLKPSEMIIKSWIYEETANIKDYHKPITRVHRELSKVIPSKILRYHVTYSLGWTEVNTDKGFLRQSWEQVRMPTIFETQSGSSEKDQANIPLNYLSQGRVFYSDLEYHIVIQTTNEKLEIYRSYTSIMDVLSAVGGLMQF